MDSKSNKTQKAELFDHQHQFIEDQNHCALCGNELTIKVESYLEDYFLREEAFCDKCDVKTRAKDHRMH